MFERESKREKILEARNREIRLKLKARSGVALVEEPTQEAAEGEEEPGEEIPVDAFFDSSVKQAEAEFYLCIEAETAPPPEEFPEEPEMIAEIDEEPVEPPPPEPPVEPAPPKKEKKGKEKGGKKKKK